MPATSINFVAILAAAVAYTILGAIWYSPFVFGKTWMKLIGKTKEQVEKDFTPMNYLWALVTSFLASYGIARILFWMGYAGCVTGLKVGLVVGVCFALGSMWVTDAFEARPKALTIVNALFHLVGMILAGSIIGSWGEW